MEFSIASMGPKPPVPDVDIDEKIVEDLQNAGMDRQIRVLRLGAKENAAYLDELRKKVKDIKGFWAAVLINSGQFNLLLSNASDRDALTYLSDIELVQDVNDPRAFELVFHFNENPYFTNKTLSKKYDLPEGVGAAPKDGSITQEMRDFEAEDLVPSATTIDWKADKDLVAKHPRKANPNAEEDGDEDFDGDFGSFFHFFTNAADPENVGLIIAHSILTDPIESFLNDDDDDDDEELDDDEGSIDLDAESDDEGPSKKKQKQ